MAAWGGSALALALFDERWRAPHPLFVVSVGEAVRRGLPTAARASITARAPLTGRLGEGQVGGELGARLAPLADALLLHGETTRPGAVLFVGHDGVRLESRPELVGAHVPDAVRGLGLGEHDVPLVVGPAGERRLAFASLASGGAHPSFVGRGGLGAVFGALGLKALVVEGSPEVRQASQGDTERALLAALLRSPRLAERSRGGSLELFALQSARADERALEPQEAQRFLSEVRHRGRSREGCRGCPTPCGLNFERPDGTSQRARFNAGEALGSDLGLNGLDATLRLLGACDRIGADAKEVGALLSLLLVAQERGVPAGAWSVGPPQRGDVAALEARVQELVDATSPWARAARDGAHGLARALGLEQHATLRDGQAVRDVSNLAALLGQCVSGGGADPMRSFPFLLEDADRATLEELCAEVAPLPPGATDPRDAAGKGRLVYWHENLVSAVDATGFCAFSMAGMLADGVCDLDRLAAWILPRALLEESSDGWAPLSPGERLLAAGANLALLRLRLERRFGAPPSEAPAWARERLAAPGMLDEYRRFRGLDGQGQPLGERLAALGRPGVLHGATGTACAARDRPVERGAVAPAPAGAAGPGAVELRLSGRLADVLGPSVRVRLSLPATVAEVLAALASRGSQVAPLLLGEGGRLVPSVWRDGERLEGASPVRGGDALDLVTAISGG